MWITINCGKVLKRWEYQANLPVSWEIFIQDKKQQLEPDTAQWTSPKLGKDNNKVVYCYSNVNAEYIMQVGIKISRRNINNLRYADDTTLTGESEEQLESLDKGER